MRLLTARCRLRPEACLERYHAILIFMAITAEQQFDAAISGVVVADRSSVGRIEIAGVDRLDLLHQLSTNALANARQGQIVATVFTTDKGRIIDYVHLLVREHSLLAMVSESSEERLSSWIEKYTIMEDVSLSKVTESTSQYTLVGPNAKQCAEKRFSHPIEQDRFFETTVSGGTVTVAYHKDFSTDFVECIVPTSDASEFADMLRTSGANFNLQMMDRDSFEAFRIAEVGRVTAEHVLSGAGLVRLYAFARVRAGAAAPTPDDLPRGAASVTARAAADDPAARRAVALFCTILGAVAGDHALTLMTRGGVFVAGGIPPRLAPALADGRFVAAFRAKGVHAGLMEAIPVDLGRDDRLGLTGAAALAAAQHE